MPARSAGLILYRISDDDVVEVLVAHPGGPFWARKDAGAWSVPKGEYEVTGDPLTTAEREFREEVGVDAPPGTRTYLGEVVQSGGKRVVAWAVRGDLEAADASSNTFELEWPRGSGKVRTFPEVDRLEWFSVHQARGKLLKGQVPLLDRLMDALRDGGHTALTEGAEGAAAG